MRWTLPPERVPEAWFNVVPHLPAPLQPPLHPATKEPVGPDDLAPLFPMALIAQEVSAEPWIDVPGRGARRAAAVAADAARAGPAARAGARHAGAHLLQGRVGLARGLAQAQHRGAAGVLQPGRGRHPAHDRDRRRASGEARCAFACQVFGLELQGVHGARLVPTEALPAGAHGDVGGVGGAVAGRRRRPPGSLGSAISDAVRDAATRDDSHYSLGSVLNHVLLHQTVIGLEAKEQLAAAGEERPDVVIASCGGGSNLGGISLPFVPDAGVRLMAVEPSSCPTLTGGRFDYDFGDVAGMTPLLPMYTLGHEFIPPADPRGWAALPR